MLTPETLHYISRHVCRPMSHAICRTRRIRCGSTRMIWDVSCVSLFPEDHRHAKRRPTGSYERNPGSEGEPSVFGVGLSRAPRVTEWVISTKAPWNGSLDATYRVRVPRGVGGVPFRTIAASGAEIEERE